MKYLVIWYCLKDGAELNFFVHVISSSYSHDSFSTNTFYHWRNRRLYHWHNQKCKQNTMKSAPANIRLDEGVFKTSWRCLHLRLQKTSSRCLQDVLIKTNIFLLVIRLQDVFKTYSTRFWEVLGTKLSKERFDFVTHLKNLWLGYKISKGELSGYTGFFKAAFSKNFMKWLLLQTEILLSKSGIRKDVAVSVNKEKRLHTKYSTGLKKGCWILATVLKYWAHCCYPFGVMH